MFSIGVQGSDLENLEAPPNGRRACSLPAGAAPGRRGVTWGVRGRIRTEKKNHLFLSYATISPAVT